MAATIELDEEKAVAAVRPDAAVRLAPQHDETVVSAQHSRLQDGSGLEERSQQFTVGRSARSLPPAWSDSLTSSRG